MEINPSFAQLFKFFRVKSGFQTISHFANTLAEKGFAYDNSLFSHWQRGSRVPTNRKLIIVLIEIFTETNSIRYEGQANLLLKSAKKIRLTLEEKEKISFLKYQHNPPSWNMELERFIAIDNLSKKLKPEKDISNNQIFRFNFALSSKTYSYFEKASKENSISKADFLRKLIEKHRYDNTINHC